MVVFGGEGTLVGPLIGAAVLGALPELLRDLRDYRLTIYGSILVLTVMLQPTGLAGRGSSLERWLRPGGGVGRRG